MKWCNEVIINGVLCRFSSSWHMDLTPNKSSIYRLAIYTDWIRRKCKEMEQTRLSFNYRMIPSCPLWLSLVFLVFLTLCRAPLPRRSARCQHLKCLQFKRETAVIVLSSPLQMNASVLVRLTIVLYLVACVLQLQRVGEVWGWGWCCWKTEPFTNYMDFQEILSLHSCIPNASLCACTNASSAPTLLKDLYSLASRRVEVKIPHWKWIPVANMWADPDLLQWQWCLTDNLCLKECLFPWCHRLLF